MTRIKRIYCKAAGLIAGLIMCCNMFSHAQVLPALQSSLTAAQKANLQEKIYVHINKNFYVTGEVIWFKIFNTDGGTNRLMNLSKVAYVELLDEKHNAVLQAKIALTQGTGNGSFYIPLTLLTGNYQLRAYTSWMKNFDAAYYFEKQIQIINPLKASAPVEPAAAVYDVQFFPEGGHLVKGLTSKIAFKVSAADGKGKACSGSIVDLQNDTVARFKSLKFGIGSFMFTPSAQSGFKAIVKVDNKVITKELPQISESGYVMQTITHDENWDVTVNCVDNSGKPVYLIVHTRHQIKIAEIATPVNRNIHFIINKDKLDDGLSYITLFDEQQRPLCERLIFKRPGKKMLINGGVGEEVSGTRQKINISIATHNQDNKSIAANLSVSVYRVDSLQREDESHIAAYLWLCADVKGYIESPDYYLAQSNNETSQALDNLLISQGWTQFDWSKILAGDKPHFTFLPEYRGPLITGSITDVQANKPAKNITVYLTMSGRNNQLYLAKSDTAGNLLFDTKDFYGTGEIAVQTNWQQDSTYHVEIASPFSEQYSGTVVPSFTLNPALKNVLNNSSISMQVQNTFAAAQLKQFNEPQATGPLFYGKPNNTYKLDDYTRFTTMEEVIHEYVRFIEITHNHGKRDFEVLNVDKMLPSHPLVLLDGRPLFDADKTFSIDPLKIKRLDVVTTNYVYGPEVFNGILSFVTYNGVSNNMEMDQRTIVLNYEGLQLDRKFYTPAYDSPEQTNSPVPDFRNALYWNPVVNTDQQGINKLSFFTGDKAGRYIGIIEGIGPDGEAGSTSFMFSVKK